MNLSLSPKYLTMAAVTGFALVGAGTAVTTASAQAVTVAAPATAAATHMTATHYRVTLPRGGASAEARAALARYPQARIAASFYHPFETGDVSSYNRTLSTHWLDVPLNPGQGPGRAGASGAVKGIRVTFPDLRITIEAIYVAGDTVTVRTTFRGTQAGPILGVPATGRKSRSAPRTSTKSGTDRLCAPITSRTCLGSTRRSQPSRAEFPLVQRSSEPASGVPVGAAPPGAASEAGTYAGGRVRRR